MHWWWIMVLIVTFVKSKNPLGIQQFSVTHCFRRFQRVYNKVRSNKRKGGKMDFLNNNTLIIVISIIFGAIFFWSGFRIIKKNKSAASWPTVAGTIISAELESYIDYDDDGDATTMYRPLIIYQYEVEGERYTNNRVKVQKFAATSMQRVSRKKLEKYPVGGVVEIHYDPDNPNDAVLEISKSKVNLPLIIGIIFLLVALYTAYRMI